MYCYSYKGSHRPTFELNRILSEERLICHLPCVYFAWVIKVLRKISRENDFRTKNDRILSIFKFDVDHGMNTTLRCVRNSTCMKKKFSEPFCI